MRHVRFLRTKSPMLFIAGLCAICLLSSSVAAGGAKKCSLPKDRVHTNFIGMKLVRIEPGVFAMGFEGEPLAPEVLSKDREQVNGDFDEHPQREVRITRPFYVGMYEVTNAQYELFDPGHKELRGKKNVSTGDDEPVAFINWYQAQAFCRWLSDKEGFTYRLPTEAEWEYACRAGTKTAYHTGPTLPAEFFAESKGLTIGQTQANAWGLFDMHGNVEEWCHDWYGPYGLGKRVDPVGRAAGDFRVTRGGSHSARAFSMRSANRLGAIPIDKHELIGFRVVLAPLPRTEPLPPTPPERYQIGVKQQAPSDIEKGPDPGKPYFQKPLKYTLMPNNDRGPLFRTHNHFISMTDCPNGDLLAIWHTCITEGGRELAIAGSRLRYGRDRWEAPSLFWDAPDRNDHGHSMWYDGKDTIYHFIGLATKTRDIALGLRTSKDSGVTWSMPRILADHGRSRMPIESVFRAHDGSIVMACDAGPASVWISPDSGLTWRKSTGHMAGLHTAVTQVADGRLMAFSRRGDIDGRMPMSISSDMGETWEYSASEFPPVHLGQRPVLLRLEEGAIFFASFCKKMMVTNASGNRHEVTGLFAAVSLDEGRTWPYRRLVSDDGPDRNIETMDGHLVTMGAHNSEPVGYLTVCQTPNRVVHLLSSRHHFAFNLEWLTTLPPKAATHPAPPQSRELKVKAVLANVYKPRELPGGDGQGWGLAGSQKPADVMSLTSDGMLKIDAGRSQFWLRSQPAHPFEAVQQRKGFSAEIRTQIIKTTEGNRGLDLELYDGAGVRYTLSIKEGGLYWYQGYILGSTFLAFDRYVPVAEGMDNTDGMHTYRLAVRPDRVAQIYRDGKLVGTMPAEYRTPRGAYFQFGAGAGVEAKIDYLAYDLTGAHQPQ